MIRLFFSWKMSTVSKASFKPLVYGEVLILGLGAEVLGLTEGGIGSFEGYCDSRREAGGD